MFVLGMVVDRKGRTGVTQVASSGIEQGQIVVIALVEFNITLPFISK